MNRDTLFFLQILRRAIHGNKSEEFPVNADLEKVIHIAQLHKILPLIIHNEKDNELFTSHQLFPAVRSQALSESVEQIKKTEEFKSLYRKMNAVNIFPLVLKGIVCRSLYGNKGDYRPSGDEDIYIREGDFFEIDKLLRSEGFQTEDDNLVKLSFDNIQEVTYTSPDTDLRIEVHLNLFGNEDAFRTKLNSYFKDAFDNYREVCFDNTVIRTLNHTQHFLFLVLHALKHFTTLGFGIRTVCDILLYLEIYRDEIDLNFVNSCIEDIGAEKFWSDLVFIGNEYLGFSNCVVNDVNCPEVLLEDILESGIYGNYSQARRTSVHMVHSAFATRRLSGKIGRAGILLDSIFPPKQRLLELCPDIETKPWLIFGVYKKRIGRFLLHNKNGSGNLAAESVVIGTQRIELLKKYKLL